MELASGGGLKSRLDSGAAKVVVSVKGGDWPVRAVLMFAKLVMMDLYIHRLISHTYM